MISDTDDDSEPIPAAAHQADEPMTAATKGKGKRSAFADHDSARTPQAIDKLSQKRRKSTEQASAAVSLDRIKADAAKQRLEMGQGAFVIPPGELAFVLCLFSLVGTPLSQF